METTTLDKLYLEWSQFTKAKTAKELRLREALTGSNEYIAWLQCHCTMYLEPWDRRIQSKEQLADAFIELLDGPKQREVQTIIRKVLEET